MKLFGYNIDFNKVQDVSVNMPKLADIRKRITTPTQLYRGFTNIETYKLAVTRAESLTAPQRSELYKVYKNIELDAHLTAAVNQRKNLTLSKDFDVKLNGEENEELEYIIKQKWFRDFIDYSLDAIYYGHSLIQFDSVIDNAFKSVELVPREYVKPEFHIVTNTYADLSGTDYLEAPYNNWCIGVGKPRDLGLYMKAAPLVIWKKNALGAWSEFVEIFGSPIRIGKTDVRDEETRANMESMLKNMGVASYGVFDTGDLIELVESNRSDAYNVFDMMIQRCNSEISKLILGQTGTLDEKAYVGSAEVQERVLKNVAYNDEFFIEGVLNYQLVPMMTRLGIFPEGVKITVKAEDDLTLIEQSKIDIELIKTGKFTFTPEYLDEKYGSEVIAVNDPTDVVNIKNRLDNLYK
jgi:phage gp29-like protein